jgi:hypothetical protein
MLRCCKRLKGTAVHVISTIDRKIIAESHCSVLTYVVPTGTAIIWIIQKVLTGAGAQSLAGSAYRGASTALTCCS